MASSERVSKRGECAALVPSCSSYSADAPNGFNWYSSARILILATFAVVVIFMAPVAHAQVISTGGTLWATVLPPGVTCSGCHGATPGLPQKNAGNAVSVLNAAIANNAGFFMGNFKSLSIDGVDGAAPLNATQRADLESVRAVEAGARGSCRLHRFKWHDCRFEYPNTDHRGLSKQRKYYYATEFIEKLCLDCGGHGIQRHHPADFDNFGSQPRNAVISVHHHNGWNIQLYPHRV